MIKQALEGVGLAPFAVAGLVIFVVVFLGIVAWTLSRSRRQVDRWSRLPLGGDHSPGDRLGSRSPEAGGN